MNKWTVVAGSIGVLLAGCASLPPATAVQDVKVLAGEWEGWLPPPQDVSDAKLRGRIVINEDGSFVATALGLSSTTGRIYASGGQMRYESSRPSNGTVILYEGRGQRILRFLASDGVTAQVTPSTRSVAPRWGP